MPENQNNTEQQKWVSWNPASLRSRTQDFVNFVKNAKEQQKMARINDSDRLNKEMMTSAMNTQYHWVANECNKSVKINQMANWARDHLSSMSEYQDIDLWDSKYTDYDIIDAYTKTFPESESIMKWYVQNEADTTCDPTETYNKLWRYQTEAQEETESWLERVLLNLWQPVRIAWEWLRDLEYWTEWAAYDVADFVWIDKLTWRDLQREKEANKEVNRIREYALDKYSKWGLNVTDEEMNQATKDFLENEKLRDERMWYSDLTQWLTKWIWWWAWAAAEVWWFWWRAALINWILSTWTETPVAKEVLTIWLSPITGLANAIWWMMDETPNVLWIWNSLDDESKELIKYFSAWKLIWDALMKKNPTTWKVEFRKTVKDAANKLWNYMVEWLSRLKWRGGGWDWTPPSGWAIEWKELSPKEAKIREGLNEEAAKTINPKYIYENQQATDTYSQMDMEQLRWIKDFKTLISTIRNMIKWKASTQDAILDTIDREYGIWTEYREPLAWRWEVSDIPSRTVEKWFKIMDEYTHFTRDKNILNIMNKVANKNKLTAKDLKMMARAIDKQFKLWKKWKTHEEIKQWWADIEAVRQELNWIIRWEVEWIPEFKDAWMWNVLEYLDKQQSPMIATVEKLVELNNKVNQIKAAIPNKSTLNKIGSFLSKFSSKWRAANTIINKMWWADYMDALLREKNLNKALNAFADLYEKLKVEPDNSEAIIKEWIKDKTNKEVAENYGWFVEWEVLEPDFNPWKSPNEFLEELLETVEVEKPENFMLWEDTQYNGQSPIDYTTPTRVTEEWYPWRYWATSESYKWKPAWDFWTPKEFESTPTVEDYVWKYWQSLESFKAQLEKAWLKTDLIDAFLNNIVQKNFKVWWKQWTLFDIVEDAVKDTKKKTWKKSKKSDK